MIYSNSKEEISKSSAQHDLESLLLNRASHSEKLYNNGIKAINHILIQSRSEERNLNRMREFNSGGLLLTLSESNTMLTQSKSEVQKTLICSKSREGAAKSSGATRFSNTSVDVQ